MKKSTFFAMLFLAATGLASGCFFEIYLNGSGKDQLMGLLSGFFAAEENSLSFWLSFWHKDTADKHWYRYSCLHFILYPGI